MAIVTYSASDAIGRIVLDRPERRNALNYVALEELKDALDRAIVDDLRALVISGASNTFCSGADLKELEDLEFTRYLRGVLDELADLDFPVIAAISGPCMGLGMQLAMACDIRIATSEAKFAIPVAKLGLLVDHWTVQRLALLAGHSTARLMLLTARPVTAGRAYEVGFVHELVGIGDGSGVDPGAQSLAAAIELGTQIAALAPLALAGSKLGLNLLERSVEGLDPDGRYAEAFATAWRSEDLMEGQAAFSERRTPKFGGR